MEVMGMFLRRMRFNIIDDLTGEKCHWKNLLLFYGVSGF